MTALLAPPRKSVERAALSLPAVLTPEPPLGCGLDYVWCCDALALCNALAPQSVDLILADLPYGTTACTWDTVIPFAPMWAVFKRVIKPRGAIVLTASQPFTSALVMSNISWFRCGWIWRKPQGTGYLNANRQPMKNHEDVIVFAEGLHYFKPQMRKGQAYRATRGAVGGFVRDKTVGGYLTVNAGFRYPMTVVDFNAEAGLHPTQKPVALFEYLIRTYTQPGDMVLDPVVGSGTTAVAARNTGRHWICGDSSQEYVNVARSRLRDTDPFQDKHVQPGVIQPSLFSMAVQS